MISREICERVLRKAVSTGADYAEIFAENTVEHSIYMIANRVDNVRDAVIAGAGIRLYKGLRSVTASTVDTTEAGLMRCAERAADALGQGTAEITITLQERIFGDIHPVKIVPASAPNADKLAILKEGYFAARDYSDAIKQVSGTLLDIDHKILIATSEGLYAQDRQIRTRLMINAVAEKNGEIISVSDELPKAFVLTQEFGMDRIYLTQFGSATLEKRFDSETERSGV